MGKSLSDTKCTTVSVHVCVCVCVCALTQHTCACKAHMCTRKAHMCTHAHSHAQLHAHAHTYIHIHTRTYTRTRLHKRIQQQIYTHKSTRIYKLTHARTKQHTGRSSPFEDNLAKKRMKLMQIARVTDTSIPVSQHPVRSRWPHLVTRRRRKLPRAEGDIFLSFRAPISPNDPKDFRDEPQLQQL